MIYLVTKINDELRIREYDGTFDTSDAVNKAYFGNLAKVLGCNVYWYGGIPKKVKANSSSITATGVLKVIPGVSIIGDVTASPLLKTPFVNDCVFNEYLTAIEDAPGLMLANTLAEFASGLDNVGVEVNGPVGFYNGFKVSTFPGNLPIIELEDDIILTYTKGMPGYWSKSCLTESDVRSYVEKNHVERFITNLSLYPEFSVYPHVKVIDSDDVVLYYLPNMTQEPEGVFHAKGSSLANDWAGTVVDTNAKQIR